MNPRRNCSRALSEEKLASLLTENADEPHARLIASLLKQRPVTTTHAVERLVRTGLEQGTSATGEDRREDVCPPHLPGAAHRRE